MRWSRNHSASWAERFRTSSLLCTYKLCDYYSPIPILSLFLFTPSLYAPILNLQDFSFTFSIRNYMDIQCKNLCKYTNTDRAVHRSAYTCTIKQACWTHDYYYMHSDGESQSACIYCTFMERSVSLVGEPSLDMDFSNTLNRELERER